MSDLQTANTAFYDDMRDIIISARNNVIRSVDKQATESRRFLSISENMKA